MSYDLYFTTPKISRDQFEGYFADNGLYMVKDDEAWYENEDTGVYFHFAYNDQPPADDDDIDHSVMFNLNFCRPHYFALEAEPEVSRFIEHFSCSIYDYQSSGMETGPYTRDGFLEGWNTGNSYGYKAILNLEDPPERIWSRSGQELEAIWSWNFLKRSRQENMGEDIFIPGIFFMTKDEELVTTCVWPDAISTLIPRVDYLYIVRKELAPRKWFKKTEDKCLVRPSEVEGILGEYRIAGYEMEAFKLPASGTLAAVRDFVRSLDALTGNLEGVPADQVLNRELLEDVKAA